MAPRTDRPTWLRSDRVLARSVAQPIQRFLQSLRLLGLDDAQAAAIAVAVLAEPAMTLPGDVEVVAVGWVVDEFDGDELIVGES